MRRRSILSPLWCLVLGIAQGSAGGCESNKPLEDPLLTFRSTDEGSRMQLRAMEQLDETTPDDEAYLQSLHRALWLPGYGVQVREAAFVRLRERDPEGLKRTLRQHLPRMTNWRGLTLLCELIAGEGWTELSPALVSSWARPVMTDDETERPEYQALVRLHGADRIKDVVFDMLIESNKVWQQGLRTRCWTLLQRLGERERLVELVSVAEVAEDDAFLIDLQAGARELGIIPHNREEILWLRELCKPERRAFWDEAVAAIAQVPASRRVTLELRDLPVVVAAARHEPELLAMPDAEIYAALDSRLRGQRRYSHGGNFDAIDAGSRDRLRDWREELTWGDLAAMRLALRAIEVPEVVSHLFDYAARDREDTTTEYGGVLSLDAKGRFEVIEFVPRIRRHDQQFMAPQAMLDQAYTSLFHFHFHVQRPRNVDYAGPGFGDRNYADNTRANCLVMTSVREGAMNVDFYRHGRVLVDLGVIELEAGERRAGTRGSVRPGA